MKLTIVHTAGSRTGTGQSISGKPVIKLGRRPDNDCVFDKESDAGVSGYHAEIRIVETGPQIADLGSTNGTLVNGQPVRQAPIGADDEIRLGANGPGFRVQYAAPTVQPAPGDKIYGQRTVGVMIQQALEAAGQGQPKGTSKSTEYFEALMETKVKRSSSKLRWIIIASVFAVLIASAILGIYLYRNRSVQVFQTTQVNYGGAEGSRIASANRYNVFLIAGVPRSAPASGLQGFCTGFAIRPDVLATNAHCVRAAEKSFVQVAALMNGASSAAGRFPVVQMVAHPGYRDGEISPDVGLMKIRGALQTLVTIADSAELSQVAPGIDMFLYGFPGRLNKEAAPEATFIDGKIGRVTSFDQSLGDFNSNTLLQHSAYCTGGTSGSPMFNSAGHVIGINAGGYVENGQALAGYNFGMRIDLVHVLLPAVGAR